MALELCSDRDSLVKWLIAEVLRRRSYRVFARRRSSSVVAGGFEIAFGLDVGVRLWSAATIRGVSTPDRSSRSTALLVR